MWTENPLFYRWWVSRKKVSLPWLSLLLAGPLLWMFPLGIRSLVPEFLSPRDCIYLGTMSYLGFLSVRALTVTVGRSNLEDQRGRWESLLTSGVSSRAIALGLWGTSLVPCLVEVALAFPVLFLIQKALELDLGQVISLGLLSLLTALFHASLGHYCSLRFTDRMRAAQWAFGWVTLWVLGSCSALLCYSQVWVGWRWLSPWIMALEILQSPARYFPLWLGLGAFWLALGSLGFSLMSWRRVESLSRPDPAQSAPSPVLARHRQEHSNPLLYRGRHRLSSSWQLALGILYGGFLSLGLGTGTPSDGSLFVFSLFHLAFWSLQAVLYPARAFCQEREQRTLDSLLVTRLSPRELLDGIYQQTLSPLSRLALFLSPFTLPLVEWDPLRWLFLQLMTQVFLWAWGSLALAISIASRNTLQAFLTIYLALALVQLGTVFCDATVSNALFGADRPWLSLASPLLGTLSVTLGMQSGGTQVMFYQAMVVSLVLHLLVLGWSRGYCLRRLLRQV